MISMKPFLTLSIAFVVSACTACGAAPTPAPGTPRASTRAAVDVAKDAWVLVANGCIDTAEALKNDNIRVQCAKYLTPAHGLIQAAADAVDANWSAGAACDLVQAGVMMNDALQNVNMQPGVVADVLPVVLDAMKLAKDLAGQCALADAGGSK